MAETISIIRDLVQAAPVQIARVNSTPGPSPPGPGITTQGQLLVFNMQARGCLQMARIRSIKPEFATDGKTRRLSDSTALFFILLWGHTDDFGFFTWDTLELASKTGRWRSQEVSKMLSALVRAGFVKRSSAVGVGLIVNWDHQHIKDRRASKWNGIEIKWDELEADATESDKNRLGEEWSGEEWSGEDSKRETRRKKPRAKPDRTPTAPVPIGQSLVAEYCSAWKAKYNDRPPLMPDDTKKLKRLGETIGGEKAAELIRGYFQVPNSWFATKRHDVQTLMSNLNVVQHFVATGQTITADDARQVEVGSALQNQLQRLGGGVL